jgi:hypothetical protein
LAATVFRGRAIQFHAWFSGGGDGNFALGWNGCWIWERWF